MGVPLELLAGVEMFEGFTEDELRRVGEVAGDRACPGSSTIFLEGDPGEAVYFVLEGRVKVYKLSADGREQILHMFGPGKVFGGVAFFDGMPMPATAEAAEDSRVGFVRRTDFQGLMDSHPELARRMLRVIGRRLREAHGLIRDLALTGARERITGYLLRLCREQGASPAGPAFLQITHQQLASSVGTSRETATRVLNELKREGVVSLERGGVAVKDVSALEPG